MCGCKLSTKTSTLIKQAFSLGHHEGRADAVGGLDCRPLSMGEAKRALPRDCECVTSKRARKFIARAHRLGYEVGWLDLFANEVAARGDEVVSIEDARSAKVARDAALAARRVVGN